MDEEQKKQLEQLNQYTQVNDPKLAGHLLPSFQDVSTSSQDPNDLSSIGIPGQYPQQMFTPNPDLGNNSVPLDEMDDSEEYNNTSGKSLATKNALSKPPNTQDLANVLFPQGSEASVDKLKEIQKNSQLAALANNLGKSAELIGTSISRTHPVATEIFDQNAKNAGHAVEDYQQRLSMEKQDPNSAISKGYQNFLKRYGVNAENASAADIQNVLLPSAFREQEQKRKLEERANENHQNALNRKASLDAARMKYDALQENRQEVKNTDRLDKLNKMINGEVASGRSAFGGAAKTFQAAERLETLASSVKDPNQLTPQQMNEMYTGLAAMFNNGQPTVSGMNKLIAPSAMKDVASFKQYILSQPAGANQGAFVSNLLDTIRREKDLAKQQMQKTQGRLLGSYSDLKDHPQMKSILQHQGLPEDIFEKPIDDKSVQTKYKGNGLILMSKDGINFKPIPEAQVDMARKHGYKTKEEH